MSHHETRFLANISNRRLINGKRKQQKPRNSPVPANPVVQNPRPARCVRGQAAGQELRRPCHQHPGWRRERTCGAPSARGRRVPARHRLPPSQGQRAGEEAGHSGAGV